MCRRYAACLLAHFLKPAVPDYDDQHLLHLVADGLHDLSAEIPAVLLRLISILGKHLHRY